MPKAHRFVRRVGVVLTTTVALALGGPLAAAVSAPDAHDAGSLRAAAKPGRTGTPLTLGSQISMDGLNHPYAIAADKTGRTYVAWISAKANGSTPRQVHLCTLALHATSCLSGIQTIDPSDASTAANLYLTVSPSRLVSLIWYHSNAGGGEIQEATSQAGAPLSAPTDVATAPKNGYLLDAVSGPSGELWTVTYAGYPATSVQVRAGTGPAVAVHAPGSLSYAALAFAGSTPVLAFATNAATGPVEYSSRHAGTWSALKRVKGAIGVGYPIGLTTTRSGLRLVAGSANNLYQPVVAQWTSHGFTAATYTGDHSSCTPTGHATTTDASGRLVDVTPGCGSTITVSNLADTRHAALSRFASGPDACRRRAPDRLVAPRLRLGGLVDPVQRPGQLARRQAAGAAIPAARPASDGQPPRQPRPRHDNRSGVLPAGRSDLGGREGRAQQALEGDSAQPQARRKDRRLHDQRCRTRGR